MIKTRKNLTGKEFNNLVVLQQAEDYIKPNGKHETRWKCKCKLCDKIFITSSQNIENKTCGCIKHIAFHPKRKHNKYDLTGEYGIGWTINDNHEFLFDLEDYEKISCYNWSTHKNYVVTHINGKRIKMHQFLGFKNYDHENRNSYDNRKKNLREITQQNNARNHSIQKNNTSGFTGVTFSISINKWNAYIYCDKKRINLGYYENKKDAIKARLQGELKYFGKEYAPQRDIFKQYGII